MVRDSALRSAFMSLFASLCGMVRDRVRPDCHHNSHQELSTEAYGGLIRDMRAERVNVLELSEAQLHDQQLSRKQPLVGSVNSANSHIRETRLSLAL
jgi:hypothetical protein